MYRILTSITLLIYGVLLFSQTIYVDPLLPADCTGNYSIANRDCSGSDGNAYKTFLSASIAAKAGSTVLIREGIYEEQLSIKNSGTEGKYITFKNYGDEVVKLTGDLTPAIWIDQKDYIIIDGLTVNTVKRWLNGLGCSNIIIRNNNFRKAYDGGTSKQGLFFQACDHVKILNNYLYKTNQDNIGMIACDHCLIEGNTIKYAAHVLWTLKCCNKVIVRGNYFHNLVQKIGEIYDCQDCGFGGGLFPKLVSHDDTKYNVVEDNVFAYTASSGNSSPYCGIQYSAQNGIIRNNTFYESIGPPLALSYYEGEAEYNYGNRISHNVFFDNDYGGIAVKVSDNYISDHQIKNNIFYKNQFVANDTRWSWFRELDGKPVQLTIGADHDFLIENNNLFSSEEDELYVIAYGGVSSLGAPQSLSWWEENHSDIFKSNLQVNPEFVDEATYDFSLKETSPMIDAGTYLTFTSSTGSNSTSLVVEDAGWFMDGFEVVKGDEIQLEGQSEYALVLSIDYTTNTLTLDRALTWEAGVGVSMRYDGVKPDLGLLEYTAGNPTGTTSNVLETDKIKVYPNPTNGLLHVELSSKEQIEEVSLFDITGKRVMLAYSSEIDISDLYSGIYFVNVANGNGKTQMEKIVKY